MYRSLLIGQPRPQPLASVTMTFAGATDEGVR